MVGDDVRWCFQGPLYMFLYTEGEAMLNIKIPIKCGKNQKEVEM